MRRSFVRVGTLGPVMALVMAACGSAVPTRPPDLAPAEAVTLPPQAAQRLVRVERSTFSEDGLTVTLHFTGGKPFNVTDPCSTSYAGFAAIVADVLEVAVIDTTTFPGQGGAGMPATCDAMGYVRVVDATLDRPFAGSTIRDRAGGVTFLARPRSTVRLMDLAPDWTLQSEGSVEESPTGRWRQTFARADATGAVGGESGILDLYQAFGGPVNVSGGDVVPGVLVGDAAATLYRHAATGELVLVWTLDGDSLALVANEADFTVGALTDLAESATSPG
ncbi:MAG: hypothetical protein ABIQ58_06685 [Candidatus Limnocylindrales bacterium]